MVEQFNCVAFEDSSRASFPCNHFDVINNKIFSDFNERCHNLMIEPNRNGSFWHISLVMTIEKKVPGAHNHKSYETCKLVLAI